MTAVGRVRLRRGYVTWTVTGFPADGVLGIDGYLTAAAARMARFRRRLRLEMRKSTNARSVWHANEGFTSRTRDGLDRSAVGLAKSSVSKS